MRDGCTYTLQSAAVTGVCAPESFFCLHNYFLLPQVFLPILNWLLISRCRQVEIKNRTHQLKDNGFQS